MRETLAMAAIDIGLNYITFMAIGLVVHCLIGLWQWMKPRPVQTEHDRKCEEIMRRYS